MADIYEQVKHLILSGELQPGTVLVERAVAERLGVSRVPVREALKRLLVEGLLETRDGKGVFTRSYNEQDILDLYVYRETLDGLATRLFTTRAEAMQLDYLEMIYSEMAELPKHYDRDEWEHHDAEFHHIIARGTRNERLIRAVSTIYEECFYLNQTFLYSSLGEAARTDPKHLQEVLAEHRAILDAIASRNPENAETAARNSVKAATGRIMATFAGRRRGRPAATNEK